MISTQKCLVFSALKSRRSAFFLQNAGKMHDLCVIVQARVDLDVTKAFLKDDVQIDLETAVIRLEEAEQKAGNLHQLTQMLRDQLDQATQSNQNLTADIERLTSDWQRAREELEQRETDFRREEQNFNDAYASQHAGLMKVFCRSINSPCVAFLLFLKIHSTAQLLFPSSLQKQFQKLV